MPQTLFVSFDDGGEWVPFQTNLPHAPVHWLTIQEHFNDLVVSTYGRGFWILDDITPLQQLSDEVLASGAHLFQPRPAYRFRNKEGPVSQPEDSGAGRNPQSGASFHFYLGGEVEGGVRFSILNGDGAVVSDLGSGPSNTGLHRMNWNLRYESSRSPRMRTKVLEHSHVPLGEDGWRPAGDGGRVSPLAPPGDYTVQMTVGEDVLSVPLTVRKDPSSAGTQADIEAQFQVILRLREETNVVVDLINEAESIRGQLVELSRLIQGKEGAEEILAAVKELDQVLIDLEMGLTDLRMAGGQDSLRWPRQLLAKLTSLAGYMGGSDFRPTMQQLEVHEGLQGLLRDAQSRLASIRAGELASLNRALVERGVDHIVGG